MIRDNIQMTEIKTTRNNHKTTSNFSPILGTLTSYVRREARNKEIWTLLNGMENQ